MRVALVHDYLTHFGGAERVLGALMELFPHAPVYTLLYDGAGPSPRRSGLGPRGGGRLLAEAWRGGGHRAMVDERRIRTSFLQRIPGARRHHRSWPLLMPLAVEQFDLGAYDVVLSASHSFTKGVITSPHTLHISYCFTPTRYLWDLSHRYLREFSSGGLRQRLAPLGLAYLRLWDYYAAKRVDQYVTVSHYVARRIRKYYQREAIVVPPPVDIQRFRRKHEADEYYLIVSRLVPYKRVDLAIAACERLRRRLLIVGEGPERDMLARAAGRWVTFLGFVSDESLARLYARARALLFPQEEDFGIVPLEAAAAGTPTVAYGAGGACETVRAGVTGVFFKEPTVAALEAAMLTVEARAWDRQAIASHAHHFRRELFLSQMRALVDRFWQDHRARYTTRI